MESEVVATRAVREDRLCAYMYIQKSGRTEKRERENSKREGKKKNA